MSKSKNIAYFCNECGYESTKWMGQCPACKSWNTMVEEPVTKKISGKSRPVIKTDIRPSYIEEIILDENDRQSTGFLELDRVLGGGIVAGSLVLVGGDPGIGKSTILLQVCRNMSINNKKVLYISGEESLKQIKMRAQRIGKITGELTFLCETNVDLIETVILETKPDAVVIDSIQTMFCEDIASAPGSVGQVRETTNQLMQIGKNNSIAIFIVGHVTKDGQVAGPRVLEHMVDTVLYFEGDRSASYRIIRAVKNRFGSTNEIGVFEMREEGLREVLNPSEYMLEGRPTCSSGTIVACSVEGTRPILIEVQALVTETAFGLPRRTATGTDHNRVNLLMAVLEKRCRIPVTRYDAYINIAGGIKMNEPALDLAIVIAIVSSYKDKPVEDDTIIFGEVGLSGEVRSVTLSEYRVKEASKMGFNRCILPKTSLKGVNKVSGIKCIGVKTVKEAIDIIF